MMTTSNEHNNAPAVPQGWVKASDRMPLDGYSDGLREIADELDAVQKDLAGIELQADGNANFYWLMRDGKWIAKIQMNGEMLVDKQVALLEAMLSAGTQIAHCPKCFTCFEVGSGSTEQNPWRDAVIEQLESWHICVPAIHDNSPRLAIKALVNIETKAALDPAVSSEAAALVAGQHNNAPAVPEGWRDFLTELSKQKPEKPDYWSSCGQCERNSSTAEDLIAATPSPAPAQGEPFGYFRAEPFGWTDCSEDAEGAIALYEHPAKPAQEVGLTDEEIEAIAKKHMSTVGDHWCNEDAIRERHAEDFARAIIAALRAKGQT